MEGIVGMSPILAFSPILSEGIIVEDAAVVSLAELIVAICGSTWVHWLSVKLPRIRRRLWFNDGVLERLSRSETGLLRMVVKAGSPRMSRFPRH